MNLAGSKLDDATFERALDALELGDSIEWRGMTSTLGPEDAPRIWEQLSAAELQEGERLVILRENLSEWFVDGYYVESAGQLADVIRDTRCIGLQFELSARALPAA